MLNIINEFSLQYIQNNDQMEQVVPHSGNHVNLTFCCEWRKVYNATMCGHMFNYNFENVKFCSGSTGFLTFWIDFGVLNRIKKTHFKRNEKLFKCFIASKFRDAIEWYLHRWHIDFYDINEKSISTLVHSALNFILFWEFAYMCWLILFTCM